MLRHGNGPAAGTLETRDDDESKKSRSISLFGISNMGVHISRYALLLVQEFSSGGPAFKHKHLTWIYVSNKKIRWINKSL